MSSPPNISRTDIARYFALLQPRLIANRLFDDPSFRTEFGFSSGYATSYAGGPAILRPTLYDGVRKMFAEESPQSLTAVTGDTITVSLGNDDLEISFPTDNEGTTTVHSLNLMLLSPSADVRQSALVRIINELGPTGPDPIYWRKEVQQGPLDDDRMDQFSGLIDASVVPNLARIGRDIMTGLLDKTHLVPRSLAYWETLCGPVPERLDQESWIKEIFEPHRRRLIERELPTGLQLCLAMGIRDDLTPRLIITHLSDDELWGALEQIMPVDDPMSLLGVADIAADRSESDGRFAALAAQSLGRLCGTQLCRGDGLDVYAFFPALVDLVHAELQVTPSIAACPAYWRRICAWTQAALLVRALQTVRFDPEQFTHNMEALHAAEARTAALLDLRQSPLSYPGETRRDCIHAEILGRLLIVRNRRIEQGQNLPGGDVLEEAFGDQAKSSPYQSQMPGPLELDRLPAWELENLPGKTEKSEEFKADLQRRADELTSDVDDSNWLVFFHLSRIIRFGDHILDQITKLVASTKFGSSEESRRAALVHMIELSYVAVSQRSVQLAEAILARCLQGIGPETDEHHVSALVSIGFIASASSGQCDATKDRFAKYLRELAFLLPQGEPCRVLYAELEVLKAFTPVGEWQTCAQAQALCLLGS
jgi:hypothetical protein